MLPKIIKLSRKADLPAIIKQIKNLREHEIIFEVEKGSKLLESPEGIKLVKKTGEVLGKKIKIIPAEEAEIAIPKRVIPKASQNTKPGFSDIRIARRPSAASAVKAPVVAHKHQILREHSVTNEGSRLEFELSKTTSRFSKIFVLCLVVLVVAVFGLAVLLPRADVTVFARSESITRDFEIAVDRSIAVATPNSLQIPGIAVSREISQTKSFSTTGESVSGTKASGTITLYNFTENTLTLKATTTTLLAGNKRYLFVSDVSGIKPNGSPNTGIKIIAESAGESGNVPINTRFQIVNAALGNANVYGQNSAAITGGTTGNTTKILSQADIDTATNELIADVISQTEVELTEQNSVKIKVLESGVKKEILAKTANKNVGDAVDSFDMTLIARVTGLAFRQDDVINAVVTKINEVLSSDKYLLDSVEPVYNANFKTIDSTMSKGVLAVHFETVAAYRVDGENLPKILAGKNESEIKEILLSKPQIDDVTVKFWPEWFVHKAPKFNGKVNIETVLSQN
jgi:hypothetical protein